MSRSGYLAAGAASAVGLLLIGLGAGCSEASPAPPPSEIEIEVDPNVATVVHITWTTADPSVGYVEYGTTKEMSDNTPFEREPRTHHTATLLGLAAGTPYFYRVVTWSDHDATASPLGQFTTDPLPTAIPRLTTEGEGQEHFTVTALQGANRTIVAVISPAGDIVWYHRAASGVSVRRAQLSANGRSVLYGARHPSDPSASELVRVALDSGERDAIPVPDLGGDFVELPDGTLAAIIDESRTDGGAEVVGNGLVEIDSAGTSTPLWSAWDCFDPSVTPGDDPDNGWSQANALAYDLGQNAYYVGLRGLGAIVKIPRDESGCEWMIGTDAATRPFADGTPPFVFPSHFQVRGSQLLVVDGTPSGNAPRLLEYRLDAETDLVELVASTDSGDTTTTQPLGSVTRLDDAGTTLINWAAAGHMELRTGSGDTTWTIAAEEGVSFGFHSLAGSLYPDR